MASVSIALTGLADTVMSIVSVSVRPVASVVFTVSVSAPLKPSAPR